MSGSLYRKYRPSTFSDLTGQPLVNRVLLNALARDTVAHAWLFCGGRGTGKTSAAKLFAKALNCKERSEQGVACQRCDHCVKFQAGIYPDYIELDAASNRGIDEFRSLQEILMTAPLAGKGFYRVFVIDEAHMLTLHAANAFLKTLEEPPGYAVFVLATTDPDKIIPTIQSRCVRLDFYPLAPKDMRPRLEEICALEGIVLDEAVLDYLIRKSDGGMRDCLTGLEQAVHLCGNRIQAEEFLQLSGELLDSETDQILSCIFLNQPQPLLQLILDFLARGKQPQDLLRSILHRCEQGLAFALKVQQPGLAFPPDFMKISQYSWMSLLRYLATIHDDLSSSAVQSLHLQVGLLASIEEVLQVVPDQKQIEALKKRISDLEKSMDQVLKGRLQAKVEPSSDPVVQKSPPVPPVVRDETLDALPKAQKQWELLRRDLRQKDPITFALVEPAQVDISDNRLQLLFSSKNQFHFRRLQEEKCLLKLREFLQSRFGNDYVLEFVLQNSGESTPVSQGVVKALPQSSETRQGESSVQEDLKRRLESDPVIKDLTQTLNAEIENIV